MLPNREYQQRDRNYDKEPKRNYGVEKYNHRNKNIIETREGVTEYEVLRMKRDTK